MNRDLTQMVQYSMKLTIFQMVRMMIDGIIGVLRTGEQSGMYQSSALNMQMMNNWNSLLVLRGVHPKESLKSCVRSIQTYHSLVSMMNQEWRLQDTTRTVCKVSTWGCIA